MAAITVILATLNGEGTLPAVLDALTRLSSPPGGWRLIAVNNGSSDNTGAVLDRYRDRLPITVLNEPEPGKNRALNRALPLLDGEIAVFIDDDILPEPDWLLQLAAGIEENPDFDIFAGTILPRWPAPPEPWMTDDHLPLDGLYGINRRPNGPIVSGLVWGGNMALRTSLLRNGYRFNENIGPNGSAHYAMGGETELTFRLEQAGHRAWFVAGAVVQHMIRPEQMSEDWIVKRAYRGGRGVCHFSETPRSIKGPKLAGMPVMLSAQLAVYRPATAVARHLPYGRLRFHILLRSMWLKGLVDYFKEMRAANSKVAAPITMGAGD